MFRVYLKDGEIGTSLLHCYDNRMERDLAIQKLSKIFTIIQQARERDMKTLINS
jgi:hypothetical protein